MHTPLMPRDAVGDATLQQLGLQRPVNQRQAIKAFVPSDRLLIVVTGGAVFATPDRQVAYHCASVGHTACCTVGCVLHVLVCTLHGAFVRCMCSFVRCTCSFVRCAKAI